MANKTIGQQFDAVFTTVLNVASVPDGAAVQNSTAVDVGDYAEVNVSVEAIFGAGASADLEVYVLREVRDAVYETVDADPTQVLLPFTPGVINRKSFKITTGLGAFRIGVMNNSGDVITNLIVAVKKSRWRTQDA